MLDTKFVSNRSTWWQIFATFVNIYCNLQLILYSREQYKRLGTKGLTTKNVRYKILYLNGKMDKSKDYFYSDRFRTTLCPQFDKNYGALFC